MSDAERKILLAFYGSVKTADLKSSDPFQKGRLQELADRIEVSMATRGAQPRTPHCTRPTSPTKGARYKSCFGLCAWSNEKE